MKILFVLSEISGGGIATYYQNYISKLNEVGVESETVVPDAHTQNSSWPGKINIPPQSYFDKYKTAFPQLNIYQNIVSSLIYAFGMFDYIKDLGKDYDVVEITDYHLFYVPWLNENNRNYKLVIRHAGSMGQMREIDDLKSVAYETILLQCIEKIYLSCADLNIVLSTSNKAYWDNRIRKSTILIRPTFTHFSNDYSGKIEGGVVIGRVQKWKNPDVLCQALQLYKPKERLDWIGGDTKKIESGKNYTEALKLHFPEVWNKLIVWKGKMSNALVLKALQTYKYIIIPSSWDTFNFSAIEAMLYKKVIICSSSVGMSDLIEHGVNGFIFENNNANDLADTIKKVESLDQNSLALIGDNAWQTVVSKLGADRAICKLQAINESNINSLLPDDFLQKMVTPIFESKNKKDFFNKNVVLTLSVKTVIKVLFEKFLNKTKGN